MIFTYEDHVYTFSFLFSFVLWFWHLSKVHMFSFLFGIFPVLFSDQIFPSVIFHNAMRYYYIQALLKTYINSRVFIINEESSSEKRRDLQTDNDKGKKWSMHAVDQSLLLFSIDQRNKISFTLDGPKFDCLGLTVWPAAENSRSTAIIYDLT
jgi:hypothetical protein